MPVETLTSAQALAHGALAAGVKVVTSYPGSPSSETVEGNDTGTRTVSVPTKEPRIYTGHAGNDWFRRLDHDVVDEVRGVVHQLRWLRLSEYCRRAAP
jgi:hypothetical protein